MYIEEQSHVIRAKNLQIFSNTKIKKDIVLLDYKKKPTFQSFLLKNNDYKKSSQIEKPQIKYYPVL